MTNQYPVAAPVFADADYAANVIGFAKTEAEAVGIYRRYYSTTNVGPVMGAHKINANPGNVDGWAPVLDPAD